MNRVGGAAMGFADRRLRRQSAALDEVGWPVHSLVSGGAEMSYPLFSVVS
jgi:hypothetical protein